VAAFERLMGLNMINPRPHSGVGNFCVPGSAYSGPNPTVGERGGFQDALWGFGLRYAIVSGVLAARSLLEARDFDLLWRKEFGALQGSEVINRALFAIIGNSGYAWLFRRLERSADARRLLAWIYRPLWPKTLLLPWARTRYRSKRLDLEADRLDVI
jgi:flavin-dependent dehydrogenase